jgi:hypothetical protein
LAGQGVRKGGWAVAAVTTPAGDCRRKPTCRQATGVPLHVVAERVSLKAIDRTAIKADPRRVYVLLLWGVAWARAGRVG